MIKFGMPTLIEYSSLGENVTLCKALKLDFVELNMNIPIFTPESLNARELVKLKKEAGIDFTIHLPEEMDLSSFQPSMRKGHIERCKEAIMWASEADIKVLNMHLNNGIYFTLPDTKVWINEKYESEFNNLLFESYDEILSFAKERDVVICTENTRNFHIPFISKAMKGLIHSYDNFFLTWDVGHDARADFKEMPVFEEHATLIKHMHLHDCDGPNDHLPLYSGKVPINQRLDFADRHNLSVVIEIKTSEALQQSVEKIERHFGRNHD